MTGATMTTPGLLGWDFNAYSSGGALNFFSSNSANNTTRYVGTATTVDVLAAGMVIDAASNLSQAGIAPGGAFRAGVTNGYLGVVFRNEGAAKTNYGWALLTTTGSTGFPATINEYCYQNDGTGIIVLGNRIFRSGFDD